jgi:YHS domain-containing protein
MSTTKQIKSALNELKSSVSHQVRCIKNDISSLDVYKSNYDALLEIPLVQKLLKENELLKKENDKLEKQLLSILLEKHNKKNKKQQKSLYKHLVDLDVDVESDAVKILDICDIDIPIKKEKPTKKENIVYELIEEKCDIVLDSNIKQNINVEKKEYIEVVVVEEEEEEVVVEEEEVVIEEEEEEVVVEEKEEEEEEVKYNAVKEVVEEEVVEEEVVEEEVVEVEEEVVEVEEEVVEVEEEVVEVEEEVEEEEEVYEVTIKGKTYYVMNEKNSIIYDIDENGDISIEVGAYKNGKPVFTKVNK